MQPFDSLAREVQWMRDAIGAVAVGAPAAYRVRPSGQGRWAVRREGEQDEVDYPNVHDALAAVRLAVLRCSAYRVTMHERDGWHVVASADWPAGAAGGETTCDAALRRDRFHPPSIFPTII